MPIVCILRLSSCGAFGVKGHSTFPSLCKYLGTHLALLEKAKLAREISDGKNEIPHKFLGRKI